MSYATKEQADKEVKSMLEDCNPTGKNSFYFPNHGALLVKLKKNDTIKEWVTKLIYSKYNIAGIETYLVGSEKK